jgi:hypothetical protein
MAKPCEQLALICTGFHRSATSVTANYLHDAGLDLGEDLMAGNISNVKGHFEDWAAVKMHDSFLKASGTDWQFHDQCAIDADIEKLDQYIQQRSKCMEYWGVKDPRGPISLKYSQIDSPTNL